MLGWLLATAEEPAETEQGHLAVVYDDPAGPSVPIYTQADERWGGLPYAGEDLATSGCGLTCAAMAWEYLSGEEWTPVQMLNAVGNSCVQDGKNYMPAFCEWMRSHDESISYSVLYESLDRVVSDLDSGRLVFGAMSGALVPGGREYSGHIVLLVRKSDAGIEVHDPCTPYAMTLGMEQARQVDWSYFISVGRES